MVVLRVQLLTLLCHAIAALSAIIRSLEYAPPLNIRGREWPRYLKKSISFGLCYAGFGTAGKLGQAWMAGEAALLCCAYDVVTDWRQFDSCAKRVFEDILRARVPQPGLSELALSLYEKEKLNGLLEDGLERGAIALRCTLKLMGCEREREDSWGNVDEVGRLLQIVDDVLDYEEDIIKGDQNCLASLRRNTYLRELLVKLNRHESRRLFGDSRSVLAVVIARAGEKAERLLRTDSQTVTSVRQREVRDGLINI